MWPARRNPKLSCLALALVLLTTLLLMKAMLGWIGTFNPRQTSANKTLVMEGFWN